MACDFAERCDCFVLIDLSDHRAVLRHGAQCTLGACDLLYLDIRFRSQFFDQRQPRRDLCRDSSVRSNSGGARLRRPSQRKISHKKDSRERCNET